MTSIVNFFPVILVALGALVSLAVEPFLKDENKHKIIPWIASLFVVFGMASFYLVNTGVCHDLYAMDPVRRLLGLAVLLCALLGVAGLQWTLAHEKFKGGEAYGLLLLASCGAVLMTQAIDFLALFIAMELTSFPVYALVGIRRKDQNAGEGVFKYFVSGSIFSAIFLYGVSLVYGATGTTHFSSAILEGRGSLYAVGVLLTIFGLLFKAGAAPVHYWVADVYTGASVAVTGFMAAVVKPGRTCYGRGPVALAVPCGACRRRALHYHRRVQRSCTEVHPSHHRLLCRDERWLHRARPPASELPRRRYRAARLHVLLPRHLRDCERGRPHGYCLPCRQGRQEREP